MHESVHFAGQNVSRMMCGGSLSGGRLRNTLVCTGIMLESAAQWNCQLKHRFVNGHFFARSFFVFCNSLQIAVELIVHESLDVLARSSNSVAVCADRTAMAASRLLGAAAACVILLSCCSWTS